MIIGTAGHIDHGKTSLVKALTGVDADRLPEEKARGITLDLGYAYTTLDGVRLGFVDVPGHERLVHHMLAGATGIDFLLLVVAADDGPMPQTREHLAIARLLGITRGAVVLSKCDAVSAERLAQARTEVAALLAETLHDSPLANAPVIAFSARDGRGKPDLGRVLLAAAAELAGVGRAARDGRRHGRFRLAIDRCFAIAGAGTVLTGTVHSGQVAVGDRLELRPGGQSVRVRGLRAHDQPADCGQAGQRLAINLAGDIDRQQIRRGQWLTDPACPPATRRLICQLHLAPALAASNGHSLRHGLRHGQPVHLHLGAEDLTARVMLLEDADCLAPGVAPLAELICDRELAAVIGDRLVLRDAAASLTLGGGLVLDLAPPLRHKRQPARLAAWRQVATGDLAACLGSALAAAPAGVALTPWLAAWNCSADAAAALLARVPHQRVETRDGPLGFAPAAWAMLAERLGAALAAEHARAPDMLGVEPERLRRLTLPALPRSAFDVLLEALLASGQVQRSAGWLHLPEHQVRLAAGDADLWQTLAPLLDVTPYAPPRVRDLAHASGLAEDVVRGLMRRVARTGALYPVAHDHYFSAAAVAALAAIAADLANHPEGLRAASLRDRIGGGRKVAIHILEFFDRIGYTRRVRDSHCLRQAAPGSAWQWSVSGPAQEKTQGRAV